MQTPTTLACLLLLSQGVYAAEQQQQTEPKPQPCNELKDEQKERCEALEHIEVKGQYIGIEVPEVIGRSYLNRDFINATPKGNGDINELIALLPGVQLSNEAYSIGSLAEISAPEISISGAQPWQTGFSLDGLNYNNRIDPASSSRLSSSSDDVSGGVQSMNVNSDVVESITVYDHNIPAEFGGFSGGIVDSKTKSVFANNSFSFGVRGNQSSWGSYHFIEADQDSSQQNVDQSTLEEPKYEKISYNLRANKQINERHGLMMSVNYLTSDISDLSLGEVKTQSRTNINAIVKYGYRNGWVDALDLTLMYSPYEVDNFITDAKDSDFHLEGGAIGAVAALTEHFDFASWHSNLNFSMSDSSREGPAHFYSWLQAKGKDWGQYADQGDAQTRYSRQGGYGALDNTQYTTSWKNTLDFKTLEFAGTEHRIKAGIELIRQEVERERIQNSYSYDSPIIWSSASTPLNCSGYTLDCQALQTTISIDELAAQLGGEIDFNNQAHITAYTNNVTATAQYFNGRLVTPAEYINVTLNRASFYVTDSITLGQLNLNLGMRYEYDDFLANHNIAPRISLGYDVFNDNRTIISAGVSRYYDSAIIGYKVKEQQRFSYREYRPIENGYLQGWLPSNYTGAFKYRFDDVNTPYDDELALGIAHSFEKAGNVSLKYVKRKKHQQFSQVTDEEAGSDGYKYIRMTNEGDGSSERYSISWSAQFGSHSLWANASYAENKVSNDDYNATAENTPLDELVYYVNASGSGELVTLGQLDQIRTNFGTPITGALGWNVDWSNSLSTGLNVTFSDSYTSAVSTGASESIGLEQSCANCPAESTLVDVYEEQEIRARTMLGLSLRYSHNLTKTQSVEIRADISNLLNARTYTVNEGASGIEPGRMFWLGVSYNYD